MALVDFSKEIKHRLIDAYRQDLEAFYAELIPKRLVLTDYTRHRGLDISVITKNLPNIKFYPSTIVKSIISSIHDTGEANMSGRLLTRSAIAKTLAKQLKEDGLTQTGALLKSKLDLVRSTYKRALTQLSEGYTLTYHVRNTEAKVSYKMPAALRKELDTSALQDMVFANAVEDVLEQMFTYKGKKRNINKTTTKLNPKLKMPHIVEQEPLLLSNIPDIRQLNAMLWQYVKRNMGTPRLNWRTGRLAKSYEITQIKQQRDGVHLYFKYMNFPYRNAFEPGGFQYKPGRSPTELGDISIRQLLVNRFNIKARIYTESVR